MAIDYKIIGMRVRELRKAKNWTQAKLAEKAGIEPSNLSHIERAATKLSLPTLINIANALGATLDEIVYTNLSNSEHVASGIIGELLADCSPGELSSLTEIIKTTKYILRNR